MLVQVNSLMRRRLVAECRKTVAESSGMQLALLLNRTCGDFLLNFPVDDAVGANCR